MSAFRIATNGRLAALVALVVLALGLAACSQPRAITIALSPDSVDLFRGGSVEVTVTLTRSGGADAAVGLTTGALPSGVSASFAPATLSGDTLTSVMTLSSSAAAAEGQATIIVLANGAGLEHSQQLDVTIASMTVTGSALGIFDEPLSGLTVYIAGRPPTVTGADGIFTIDGVVLPYDLTVANGADWAHTILGLSTPTPTVQSLLASFDPPQVPTSTVQGTLSGSLVPVPANHRILVCPEGIATPVYTLNGCGSASAGQSTFSFTAAWTTGGSPQARLRAYVYQMNGSGEVIDIVGAGSVLVNLVEASSLIGDITIGAAPAKAQFSLDVSAPAGMDIDGYALTNLNDHASFSNNGSAIIASPGTLMAPFIAGADYTVYAAGYGAGQSLQWRTGLSNGANAQITLPSPPSLVSPADGATGVTHSTQFTISNPIGGSLHYLFSPTFPAVGTALMVSTASNAVQLPDLTAIGISLLAATDYSWSAVATPQTTSANDMVTGEGHLGPYLKIYRSSSGGEPIDSAGGILVTINRDFTTQ